MQVREESPAQIILAGLPGFEPGRAVLETAMIPFHHSPNIGGLETPCPTIERQAYVTFCIITRIIIFPKSLP